MAKREADCTWMEKFVIVSLSTWGVEFKLIYYNIVFQFYWTLIGLRLKQSHRDLQSSSESDTATS